MCTGNFDMLDSWSKRLYRFSAMLFIVPQYHPMFLSGRTHTDCSHFCNKELTQNLSNGHIVDVEGTETPGNRLLKKPKHCGITNLHVSHKKKKMEYQRNVHS